MINGYTPCTLDELMENNDKWQDVCREEIEKKFIGTYLPAYIPELDVWGVETCHGIEVGDVWYVTDQFCMDSIMYLFYDKYHKTQPNHVHGSFESVIESLLSSPDDFSIEGFEELYSMQEQRVLMNIKYTINQVKKLNRPITQEEAKFNRKIIGE